MMRYLEWLFPIHRYVRLRSKPGAARVWLTVVGWFLIMWVAVGITVALGFPGYPGGFGQRVMHGLRLSFGSLLLVFGHEPQSMNAAAMFLRPVLMGGTLGTLLLAYGVGCLRLRKNRPARASRWLLKRYILLGLQSMAIYWAVWGAWLTAFDHHIDLHWLWELTGVYVRIDPDAVYWVRLCVPAGVIALVTGWQAASAVKAASGVTSVGPSG